MTEKKIILGDGGHAKVLAEIVGRNVVRAEDDELVFSHTPKEVELYLGIGSRRIRRQVFEKFKAKGYSFGSAIHPSAVIAEGVVLGEGVQIMAGAVIQPGCTIGDNVLINTRAGVDHDCIIGKHVHIAPGATLCGSVEVGDGAMVFAGQTVFQGVRIPSP